MPPTPLSNVPDSCRAGNGMARVQFDYATPDGWSAGQIAGFSDFAATGYVTAGYGHYYQEPEAVEPEEPPKLKSKAAK